MEYGLKTSNIIIEESETIPTVEKNWCSNRGRDINSGALYIDKYSEDLKFKNSSGEEYNITGQLNKLNDYDNEGLKIPYETFEPYVGHENGQPTGVLWTDCLGDLNYKDSNGVKTNLTEKHRLGCGNDPHGTLAGLSNDDHLQYFNAERLETELAKPRVGDVKYDTGLECLIYYDGLAWLETAKESKLEKENKLLRKFGNYLLEKHYPTQEEKGNG